MKKTRNYEIVSANQKSQTGNKLPMRAKLESENKLTSEGKPQASVENQRGEEVEKANKTSLKQIAAIIRTQECSESESDARELMNDEHLQMANKSPIKTPRCYSVYQIDVLQTMSNFTFAAKYETDEFLQKIIQLLKKPDSTKINRLPILWREKFRCLSLDDHDFMYMDERLVIPKTLRQILMRSLHYGHPGRDSMLATVSNVWWPRLHRDVVAIART